MNEITSKVEKQEIEITYIKKTLDELVATNKEQSRQLNKIGESIAKQEVILEKISNLEDKYSDGIKRVHDRIDEEISKFEKAVEENKKDIVIARARCAEPCSEYLSTRKDIDFINEKLEKHGKIFWWLGTLIVSSFVLAVIDAIMKK